MAGIYIPGIEMPNGGTIKIEIGYDADGHQMAMTEDYKVYDVIPVPDHGRLVEEDTAYDKIAEEAGEEAGNYVDMDVVGKGLENTPTIIPADKKED